MKVEVGLESLELDEILCNDRTGERERAVWRWHSRQANRLVDSNGDRKRKG